MIKFAIRYCEATAKWQAETAVGWSEPMSQARLAQWLFSQVQAPAAAPSALRAPAPKKQASEAPEVYHDIQAGNVVRVERRPQPKAIASALASLDLDLGL